MNTDIPYSNQGAGGLAYSLFCQIVDENPREYLTAQEKYQLMQEQEGVCAMCQTPVTLKAACIWEGRAAQMDHVVPRCQGGTRFQAFCRPSCAKMRR